MNYSERSGAETHAAPAKEEASRPLATGATAESDSADASTEKKGPARVYRGLADLVRGLPPELIPSGDQGWDQFQVDNLRQWMTEHPRHQQFSQHLVLTRVTVGRFLGAPKATPWRITLSFRPRQVPLRNMTLTEDIQVSFFATEDLARRAEALTEGTSLGLSGTLERLSFARGFHIGKLQHLMRLHFSQIEVNHPQLRYRGAVAP